jgi:hypothetical protein
LPLSVYSGLAISQVPRLRPYSRLACRVRSFLRYHERFSWLTDPGYVKNFAGFVQALTVGLPQYSAHSTWMFFRNSVVSDFAFHPALRRLHELQAGARPALPDRCGASRA